MNLPHPLDTLVGCCWLPRLAAKTRWHLGGEMPLSYRVALGSKIGVDGYFTRHFQIGFPRLVAAIRSTETDDGLGQWFLAQRTVNAETIQAWNETAPLLGTKGHPGYLTLQTVRWFFYPKSIRRPVAGIFASIVQDEDLDSRVRS